MATYTSMVTDRSLSMPPSLVRSGTTTGYDQAVALPAMQAGGDEGMFKENNKKFEVLDGSIEFKVTSVNTELGEFGGVFVQKQPSDTDLGSKVPKELLLKGAFFATVVEQ